jgi:hypothetical protein
MKHQTKADKRARSLLLNPRPRYTTPFGVFNVAEKCTLPELVQAERIARCVHSRFRR